MEIIISNASKLAIYEQIYKQIKDKIISGKLNEGDLLPSMRAMAKDLRVSIITTKRAYDELERDGFIYTVAGKGCFVADKNLDIIKENYLKKIEEHMLEINRLAAICEIDDETLANMYSLIKEEH
ncbi:MAG: GntR family transcriptional regulator [Christensenellaceae bacterium]|nr:GntR family transcriptional regulator [Christensenellaceae bacterium]